jgi:coenzyme PQQ biosynthesis protein C
MVMVMETDSFVTELRTQSQRYHSLHPFHLKMNAGALSRRHIQGWVANRFYYQENIPRKDAAILANCPLPEVRRRWIRRILDHDGAAEGEGGIEAWLRLGEAVGLTRKEIEEEWHVVPGVRFAVDAYVAFARTRPWVEAVASSLTVRVPLSLDRSWWAGLLPCPPDAGTTRLRARPAGGDGALPDTGGAGAGRGSTVLQVRRSVEHAGCHRPCLCG